MGQGHYFECKKCGNKEFRPVYSFCLRFYKVNFSDDLLYDKINEEKFECTKCNTKYTREEIQNILQQIKQQRKGKD